MFDPPFWIALLEREEGGQLQVTRVVFGAEPTPPQVLAWVLDAYPHRIQFGTPLEVEPSSCPVSPKKTQRETRRFTLERGPLSAAQDAVRLDLEKRKQTRKVRGKLEGKARGESGGPKALRAPAHSSQSQTPRSLNASPLNPTHLHAGANPNDPQSPAAVSHRPTRSGE